MTTMRAINFWIGELDLFQ